LKGKGALNLLKGKILETLSSSPAPRTRPFFQASMQRLGGSISLGSWKFIRGQGEFPDETARTVAQYADVIVVRHPVWDRPKRPPTPGPFR